MRVKGGYMTYVKETNGVVEVFRIETAEFTLSAVLANGMDGRSLTRGWAKFKDGEKCYFSAKSRDQRKLRNRMMRAFLPIATFYGTELVHEKIQGTGETTPVCHRASNAARILH